jgi:hypothetical protein
MAEFFMEGYIERLLDVHDPVARQLRKLATFYCVPNMCPGKWSCRSSSLRLLLSLLTCTAVYHRRRVFQRPPAHERGGGEPEPRVVHHWHLRSPHAAPLPGGLPR